jgi:hypothetical protein
MEGIENPHTDKYKEITNNWNYDAGCTLTSLPVWDLQNFKRLIFVVQSVLTLRTCAGKQVIAYRGHQLVSTLRLF